MTVQDLINLLSQLPDKSARLTFDVSNREGTVSTAVDDIELTVCNHISHSDPLARIGDVRMSLSVNYLPRHPYV